MYKLFHHKIFKRDHLEADKYLQHRDYSSPIEHRKDIRYVAFWIPPESSKLFFIFMKFFLILTFSKNWDLVNSM
jgi:hypothetical protein